jgi:hypothetical protein
MPAQLERMPQLARDGFIESLLLCPSKIFRQEKKNTLSLVMAYSTLFNNVFNSLNLFLNDFI